MIATQWHQEAAKYAKRQHAMVSSFEFAEAAHGTVTMSRRAILNRFNRQYAPAVAWARLCKLCR